MTFYKKKHGDWRKLTILFLNKKIMANKLHLLLLLVLCVFVSCSDVKKADDLRIQGQFEKAFELYQKAADSGDAYAEWRLADAYNNGDGVDFNHDEYIKWLNKAAKDGSEEAQFDLALSKLFGYWGFEKDVDGAIDEMEKIVTKSQNPYVLCRYAQLLLGEREEIEQDKDKAMSILNKIKDKEDPAYLYAMACVYETGTDDIDIDYRKRNEYLEKAFAKGESFSATVLGNTYLRGNDEIEINLDKAIEWFKKGIEKNSTTCMIDLSEIYLNSSNDSSFSKYQNKDKAIELIKKAMKHGESQAFQYMGFLYSVGEAVQKDDKKSFELTQKAYEMNNSNAAFSLAFKYIDGVGTEKDVAKGIKVWERAAELGNAAAANNLFCYYYGIEYGGKVKNLEKAREYLFQAAKLKDDQACYNLAFFYYSGSDIVKKDKKQAFIYAKMAADQNHPDACNMIAYLYENGIGCDKDPKKAQEYRDKVKPQERKK